MTSHTIAEFIQAIDAYLSNPTNPAAQDVVLPMPNRWLGEIVGELKRGLDGTSDAAVARRKHLALANGKTRRAIESFIRSGIISIETSQGFFAKPAELREERNLHYFTLALFYFYLNQLATSAEIKVNTFTLMVSVLDLPVTRAATARASQADIPNRLASLMMDEQWLAKKACREYATLDEAIRVIRNGALRSKHDPYRRIILTALIGHLDVAPLVALRGSLRHVRGIPEPIEDMIVRISDEAFEQALGAATRVSAARISPVVFLLVLGGLSIFRPPYLCWPNASSLATSAFVACLESFRGRSVRDMLTRVLFKTQEHREVVAMRSRLLDALPAVLGHMPLSELERLDLVESIKQDEVFKAWLASRHLPFELVLRVSMGTALAHERGSLRPSSMTDGWPPGGDALVRCVRQTVEKHCEGSLTLRREDLLAIALHVAGAELTPKQWRDMLAAQ